MPAPEIRVVTRSDAEAALAYFEKLVKENLRTIYRIDSLPTLDEEIEYLRGFETDPDSAWFAAVSAEGQIIGNLEIAAETRPQTRHVGNLGMSVLAPYRAAGLGTRLLETAITWARSTDLRRLQLEVIENNPRAIRLYERFGFEVEGRKPGGIEVEGEYLDLIQMGRASS